MFNPEYIDTMLYELSQMDPYVIGAAYLYAKNYCKFGTDVTEKWTTAVQQAAILERSYNSGVKDTLERLREMEKQKWIPCNERLPKHSEDVLVTDAEGNCAVGYYRHNICAWDSVNFGFLEHENRNVTYGIGKVVAWTALPELYKAEIKDKT